MKPRKILIHFLILLLLFGISEPIVYKLRSDFIKVDSFLHKINDLQIRILNPLPFSLGDLLYLLMIMAVFYLIFNAIRYRNISYAMPLLYGAYLLYFVFLFKWGYAYKQTQLQEVPNNYTEQTDKETVLDMLHLLIPKLNKASKGVSRNQEGLFFIKDVKELANVFLKTKPISPNRNLETACIKPSLFSWIIRYFGLAGYYNPFTAEAQYNTSSAPIDTPFTILHELAHQQGYAREYEANYLAFVWSVQTKKSEFLYSAYYRAFLYLVDIIYQIDEKQADMLFKQLDKLVIKDNAKADAIYEKYDGPSRYIFSQLNNFYLKSNGQQEGINSYSLWVWFLIDRYKKEKQGVLPRLIF